MKEQRNYGIDALRILATYMICTLHILGHGGVFENTSPSAPAYMVVWALECFAYCAVNCYGLISGYVAAKHKSTGGTIKRLSKLWLQVEFYMLSLFALSFFVEAEFLCEKHVIFSLAPILTGNYWYITAYFAASLFFPLLIEGMERIPQKTASQLIKTIFGFVIIAPVVISQLSEIITGMEDHTYRNIFKMNGGYSAWWLLFLFVVGMYIGKYGLLQNFKTHQLFLIYVFVNTVTLIAQTTRIALENESSILLTYISPTVFASAVLLLLIFERIQPHSQLKKMIAFAAPTTLGIYIIQEHPYIRERLLTNRFVFITQSSAAQAAVQVLSIALIMFLMFMCIEKVRIYLFAGVSKLGGKITKLPKKIPTKTENSEK